MLRFLLKTSFFTFANSSKKYFIKSGAYLVEAQPQKPILPLQKFQEDETRNVEKQKLNLQFRRKLKAKWSQPTVREKYESEYKVLQQQYKKKYQYWETNFHIPFKNPTFIAQFAKKVRNQGLLLAESGQGSYVKKSSELMKLLTPEEKLQIQQDILKIKQQRHKVQKKYQFPVKLYDTQRSYDLKHTQPKSKPTEAIKKKLQADYENYVNQWKGQVEKWLKANNFDLSVDEFVKMYDQILANKQAKKEIAKSAKKEQALRQLASKLQVKAESNPAPTPEQTKAPIPAATPEQTKAPIPNPISQQAKVPA